MFERLVDFPITSAAVLGGIFYLPDPGLYSQN